jgi:hypothetical protein
VVLSTFLYLKNYFTSYQPVGKNGVMTNGKNDVSSGLLLNETDMFKELFKRFVHLFDIRTHLFGLYLKIDCVIYFTFKELYILRRFFKKFSIRRQRIVSFFNLK